MDDYDETVDITELTKPLFEALLLLKREGVLQWEGSIGEWRATLSVELDDLEDPSGGFQLLTAPDDIHFRPDLMTPRLRQIPTVRNVSGRRKSSTSSHERYGFESAVYRFLETCSGGTFVV